MAETDFIDHCRNLKKVADRLKKKDIPLWGAAYDSRYDKKSRKDASTLDETLDCYINSDLESVYAAQRVWMLMQQGIDAVEFEENLAAYDFSHKCGAVWNTNSVAYRCNTCAKNSCMSLCQDCYDAGGHKDHDSTRFFSLAGGACDCGSDDTLNPDGFCNRHGAEAVARAVEPPKDFLSLTEFVIVKLLLKLFSEYRKIPQKIDSLHGNDEPKLRIFKLDEYSNSLPHGVVELLLKIISKGAAPRRAIVDILLNEDLYARCNNTPPPNPDVYIGSHLDSVSSQNLNYAFRTLPSLSGITQAIYPEEYELFLDDQNQEPQKPVRPHFKNMADELSFWLIRLSFPQPLIDLTLALTSEVRYRDVFGRSVIRYYEYSIQNLADLYSLNLCDEANELISRMIHVSVQICSSEVVSEMLQKEQNAIDVILNAAIRFFSPHVTFRSDVVGGQLYPYISGDGNYARHRQSYWSFLNDLQNLLSHCRLGYEFICSPKLVQKYMILVRVFQGANTFHRVVVGNHIEHDHMTLGQRLFGVEYELESILLMNLCAAVKKLDHDGAGTRLFLSAVIKCLEVFTNSHRLDIGDTLPYCEISLHIPLHRMLSAFLFTGGIYGEHLRLCPQQLNADFFRAILIHPLKIMLTLSEATTTMWVRNGTSFRSALSFYRHYVFGMSFLDLDMFLIRYCAGVAGPTAALKCLFAAFHVPEMLNVAYKAEHHPLYYIDKDWIPLMAEALLSRICEISTFVMTTLDMKGLKRDVLAILFLADCSHSTISECLCDRGHDWNRLINTRMGEILDEIADFKTPDSSGDTLTDGCYKVKRQFWFSDFDPIYSRMRCFNSDQFVKLCKKVEEIDKQEMSAQKKELVGYPWTPFRAFSFDYDDQADINSLIGSAILCDSKMFDFIGHVLHLTLKADNMTPLAPQQAVYLLTLAVTFYKSPLMSKAVEKFWSSEIQEAYSNKLLLYRLFSTEIDDTTVFNLLVELFRRELRESSKPSDDASLARALEQQINENPERMVRIVGGGIEYIGRLFCFLNRSGDSAIVGAIDDLLSRGNAEEVDPVVVANNHNAKRLSMKRKRENYFARENQKNARILKNWEDGEYAEMDVDEEEIECLLCKEPGNFVNNSDALLGTFTYVAGAPAHMLSVDKVYFHDELFHDFHSSPQHTRISLAKEKATKCVARKCLPIQFCNAIAGYPSAEIRSCGHLVHMKCYWSLISDIVDFTRFYEDPKARMPCPICRQDYNGFMPIVNPIDLTKLENAVDASSSIDVDDMKASILKTIDDFEAIRHSPEEKKYCKSVIRLCKEVTKRFQVKPTAETALLTLIENGTLLRRFGQKDYNRRAMLFGALAARVLTDIKNLEAPFTRKFLSTLFYPMFGKRSKNCLKVPTLFFHMKTMLLRGMCFIASQKVSRAEMIAKIMLLFKHLLFAALTKNVVLLVSNKNDKDFNVMKTFAVTKSTLTKTGSQYDIMCAALLSSLEKASSIASLNIFSSTNSFSYSVSGEVHKILEHTVKEMTLFVLTFFHYSNLRSIDDSPEFSSATSNQLFDYLNTIHPQEFSFDGEFIVNWVNHYMADASVRKIDTELNEPLYWKNRTLFKLPESYEEIFKHFHSKFCEVCSRISQHPLLCLVCGKLVCMELVRDGRSQTSEMIKHTKDCTSGNTCFLSILTSLIVVVQNYEYNIWGSPYLDAHGEEDRFLRRGKPLFLSESRYRLLQRDWLTQVYSGHFMGFSTLREEIRPPS